MSAVPTNFPGFEAAQTPAGYHPSQAASSASPVDASQAGDLFHNIPGEMHAYAQWVLWAYVNVPDRAKPAKMPFNPVNFKPASVTNPETWSTFDRTCAVCRANRHRYSGIGFVLTENDPFTFIDFDDPYQLNEAGAFKHSDPHAVLAKQKQLLAMTNSYAEYSPSRKGIHIIVRGIVPHGRRTGAIEIYSSLRYMTMTGDVLTR